MARNTISRPEQMDGAYSVLPPAPPREAWVGRIRYIIVPVIAVLAIVSTIYFLDDSKSISDTQGGAATAVRLNRASNPKGVAPRVGSPAPDFTLVDLEGKPVKLSDFRGNAVFLNFFATWCPPCRAEMPDIVATYNEQKANSVVVLAVDMQEDGATVANYAKSAGMTFPIVLDRAGDVTDMYRITSIPTSFFIDKDGVLRDLQIGAMSKSIMADRLKKALNPS